MGNVIYHAGPQNEEKQKLDMLVNQTDRVLYRIKSTFPFDFFPDELVIDISKISLISRIFILSHQIRITNIANILDSTIITGPIFATLQIAERVPNQPPIIIHYLIKKHALKANQLIQGLQIASQSQIDLTKIPDKELIIYIENIGKTKI